MAALHDISFASYDEEDSGDVSFLEMDLGEYSGQSVQTPCGSKSSQKRKTSPLEKSCCDRTVAKRTLHSISSTSPVHTSTPVRHKKQTNATKTTDGTNSQINLNPETDMSKLVSEQHYPMNKVSM